MSSVIADELIVKVSTDTSQAEKGLNDMGDKADKAQGFFSKLLGNIGGFATAALSMAGVNLGLQSIQGAASAVFDEMGAMSTQTAQLNAVLQSTHDISGESSQAVLQLSQQLSNLSGASQSNVMSGENMLLTFTNIGKNVFPQASQALDDLAIKMANGDASQANFKDTAIQLGKALNDPITGITALSRVGVTFTQQQKDQIAAMMQAGNTAGAQGVILQELNREFGGSAAAAGSTLPGALDKLKNTFVDLGSKALTPIVSAITPLISSFSSWLPGAIDKAQQFLKPFGDELSFVGNMVKVDIAPAFDSLKQALGVLLSPFQSIGDTAGYLPAKLAPLNNAIYEFTQLFDDIAAKVPAILQSIGSNFMTAFNPSNGNKIGNIGAAVGGLGEAVKSAAEWVVTNLVPALGFLAAGLGHVAGFIANLVGWINNNEVAMDAFKAILIAVGIVIGIELVASFIAWAISAGAAAIATIAATWPILAIIAAIALLVLGIILLVTHWKQITDFLGSVWANIVVTVKNGLDWLGNAFGGLGDIVSNIGKTIGNAIKGGINDVIDDINGFIRFIDSIQIHIPAVGVGPFKTPAFDWNGVNIGQIPHLAQGGNILSGGLAVVGDGGNGSGAELVSLPTGATVTPLNNNQKGPIGQKTIIINAATQNIDENRLAILMRQQDMLSGAYAA